jgi:hypothetical protein
MNIKGTMILEYKFTAIEAFYDLGFIVELDGLIGLLGINLKPLISIISLKVMFFIYMR